MAITSSLPARCASAISSEKHQCGRMASIVNPGAKGTWGLFRAKSMMVYGQPQTCDEALNAHIPSCHQRNRVAPAVASDEVSCRGILLLNPYVAGRNESFLIIGNLRCNVRQQNQIKESKSTVPRGRVESRILFLRGETVILDKDLAELYGVKTSRLNQQVRRNIDRFPEDFAFLLSIEEFNALKSHFATSSTSWGGRRKPPIAFTEHGALMTANILKTQVAVQASIQVVRTFVRLRTMIATHHELAEKLKTLEQK